MGMVMSFGSFPWLEFMFIGLTIAIGAVVAVSMLRDVYLPPMLRSAGLIVGSSGIGAVLMSVVCGSIDVVGMFGCYVCLMLSAFVLVYAAGKLIDLVISAVGNR